MPLKKPRSFIRRILGMRGPTTNRRNALFLEYLDSVVLCGVCKWEGRARCWNTARQASGFTRHRSVGWLH